jgi:hypothetical protein
MRPFLWALVFVVMGAAVGFVGTRIEGRRRAVLAKLIPLMFSPRERLTVVRLKSRLAQAHGLKASRGRIDRVCEALAQQGVIVKAEDNIFGEKRYSLPTGPPT